MKRSDDTTRELIYPERVVASENAERERLLLRRDPPFIRLPEKTDGLTKIGSGGFVLLDFGRELHGGVRLLFGETYRDNATVRIRFGESASEACAEIGEKNAGNYHSPRDFVYPAITHSDTECGQSGFRFVRIDVPDGEYVYVKQILAVSVAENHEELGSFSCSDDTINAVYRTAIDTVRLCMQNGTLWDGIKRDRTTWIGDLHPEMLASFQAFGNTGNVLSALRAAESYVDEGGWINCIPSYSAWWLTCLADYYEYVGDRDILTDELERIRAVALSINNIVTEEGDIDYSGSKLNIFEDNEYFFDWPTNFTPDSKDGMKAVLAVGLGKIARALDESGTDVALAEKCAKIAERIAFSWYDGQFKQVVAMRYFAGKEDENSVRKTIGANGAAGLTGFTGYYILAAGAECGLDMLGVTKDYYGAMLGLGATSFWEDFDVGWLEEKPCPIDRLPDIGEKDVHGDFGKFCYKGFRHSLCHGWTAGVAAFLSRYVLGVRPAAAGFKKVRIEPHLGSLTFAEGTVPTPHGVIRVRVDRVGEKTMVKAELPEGVEAE